MKLSQLAALAREARAVQRNNPLYAVSVHMPQHTLTTTLRSTAHIVGAGVAVVDVLHNNLRVGGCRVVIAGGAARGVSFVLEAV